MESIEKIVFEEKNKESVEEKGQYFDLNDINIKSLQDNYLVDGFLCDEDSVNDMINFISIYNRAEIINSKQYQMNKGKELFKNFIDFKNFKFHFFKDSSKEADLIYYSKYTSSGENINISNEDKKNEQNNSNDNTINDKSIKSKKKEDSKKYNINKSNNNSISIYSSKSSDLKDKSQNISINNLDNCCIFKESLKFKIDESSNGISYEQNAINFMQNSFFFK